jgi:hypothetical protein
VNEHLNPVFESVLPALTQVGIHYWVYGGVAIAGINGAYIRENPDVDVFVRNEDFDKAIESVERLEKTLGWKHEDAVPQRGRRKRDWYVLDTGREIFSIVPVFGFGGLVRFVFGRDFVPTTVLTSVSRRVGSYVFNTPSTEFMKELLVNKVESGKLLRERRKKLKLDARVVMDDDEYRTVCERLDRAEIERKRTMVHDDSRTQMGSSGTKALAPKKES